MATSPARPRIPVTVLVLATAGLAAAVVAGCVDSSARPSIVSSATTYAAPTTASTSTIPIDVATSRAVTPPSLDIGSTIPLTSDTSDIPLATVTGASADIPGSPQNSADLPADARAIKVTVGVDSSPTRVEKAALEETIAIEVTNPNTDDVFVLQGYHLGTGTTMPKGRTETFTFTATQAGSFQLTSTASGAVLLVLQVG